MLKKSEPFGDPESSAWHGENKIHETTRIEMRRIIVLISKLW